MKLSIITINYNNLAGLKKTAASVLAQTWRDFEWIIVDGGSTDGSKEYIEQLAHGLAQGLLPNTQTPSPWRVTRFSNPSYTAQDPTTNHPVILSSDNPSSLIPNPSSPIPHPSSLISNPSSLIPNRGSQSLLWCSEPDKGIYNAMNKGIVMASGEYLNFMNSGDCFYENDILEKVSKHLKKEGIGVFWGKTIDALTGNPLMPQPTKETFHKTMMVYSLCHQAAFIKRSLQLKYFYDETFKVASDWKFFFKALVIDGNKVELLDDIIAIAEPGGVSSIFIERRNEERYQVILEHYGKGIADLIQDYNALRWNEIIVKTNVLLKEDVHLYRMARRFLSLMMMIHNLKKRY